MRAMIDRSRARGSVKAVGVAVAFYPPPGTNLSYPSNETLVADWGFSERTVQRGLRALEALGELQRQPRFESSQRPRVYLIEPGFRRQMSMLELGRQSDVDARLTPVMTPVTSRGRVEGRDEGLTAPPTPHGGELVGTSSLVPMMDPTPRVSDRSSGAAARRRRRRRRRDDDGASFASGVDCPLNDLTDGVAKDRLGQVWADLRSRLREQVSSDLVDIWLAGSHLHRVEAAAIELAVKPDVFAWVLRRWAPLVEQATGLSVQLIPCKAAEGAVG
jgi:hypothetical protein